MNSREMLTLGTILLKVTFAKLNVSDITGAWPSGKAHGFGPCIRGFESLRPSHA